MVLQVAIVAPRYSTFVLDRATIGCFLLLHATTALPRENMYLEVDRRSDASPAQSASVYSRSFSAIVCRRDRQRFSLGLAGLAWIRPNWLSLNRLQDLKPEPSRFTNRFRLNRFGKRLVNRFRNLPLSLSLPTSLSLSDDPLYTIYYILYIVQALPPTLSHVCGLDSLSLSLSLPSM